MTAKATTEPTEVELRKQATVLFKDNCLDDPIDMWVRIQLLKREIAAERERCAGYVAFGFESYFGNTENVILNEILANIREGKPHGKP